MRGPPTIQRFRKESAWLGEDSSRQTCPAPPICKPVPAIAHVNMDISLQIESSELAPTGIAPVPNRSSAAITTTQNDQSRERADI